MHPIVWTLSTFPSLLPFTYSLIENYFSWLLHTQASASSGIFVLHISLLQSDLLFTHLSHLKRFYSDHQIQNKSHIIQWRCDSAICSFLLCHQLQFILLSFLLSSFEGLAQGDTTMSMLFTISVQVSILCQT